MKNILFVITLFFLAGILPAAAAEVPVMSKEELRGRLGSYDIAILDARTANQWDYSEFKIPGAIRAPATAIETWSRYFSKNQLLVVYCACNGLGTSGTVVHQLIAKGFTRVYALDGGWKEWYGSAYPIEEK